MNEPALVIFLVIVGLGVAILLIGLAFGLLATGLVGAVFLFAFAGEQGFIGVAVYFACWIFMFPLMLASLSGSPLGSPKPSPP